MKNKNLPDRFKAIQSLNIALGSSVTVIAVLALACITMGFWFTNGGICFVIVAGSLVAAAFSIGWLVGACHKAMKCLAIDDEDPFKPAP